MITVIVAYHLTCQGCGLEVDFIPPQDETAHTLDTVVQWLRAASWWVAREDIRHIRCPQCGDITKDPMYGMNG